MPPFTILRISALILTMITIFSCSSGGGGGGAVSGKIELSGTVAAEQIIGSTSIAFRDSSGKIIFISTQPDGTFIADLAASGLTLPVIFRAPNPDTGKFMYSYASAEGTSNIHPLTDPILRIWFKAKGLSGDIDSDFISATPFTLPTPQEIAFIKTALGTILGDFLMAASVSPGAFDLITSAFAANGAGFDSILKGSLIDATDDGVLNLSVVPFTALDTVVTGSGFAPEAFLDSSVITLATDTVSPAPPSGLTASGLCGNKALVTWTTSTSADVASYRVSEQTKGYLATATYPAYIVPDLSTFTTYTFSAKAVDAAGNESTPSNIATVDIGTCALPFVPNALSSAPTVSALSSSRLRLDWTDSQGSILEYRVYSVGTASFIARTMGKTFTDFQLPPATQRCYTVTLVNTIGESAQSGQACGTTLPGVPSAPTNVAALSRGSGQVAVMWDPVGNAASYRLYRSLRGGITKANYTTLSGGTLTSGITGTGMNVPSLAVGTNYYFMVTAVNGTNEESVESVEVVVVP